MCFLWGSAAYPQAEVTNILTGIVCGAPLHASWIADSGPSFEASWYLLCFLKLALLESSDYCENLSFYKEKKKFLNLLPAEVSLEM